MSRCPFNGSTIGVPIAIIVLIFISTQAGSQQVYFEGPINQEPQQQQQRQRFVSKPLKLIPSASEQSTKSKLLKQSKANSDQRINLVEADENGLYLVGLFDIHNSNPRVPFKCGPIDVDAGEWQSRRPLQNLEAFLWAIEQVNADEQLLPGIKLGSLVLDTCSSFLRTNQQLANLLHPRQSATAPPHAPSNLPNVRQLMAIVADNQDWPSVEAVASMSSAVGLSTFVTQSRSTKLGELARRYASASAQAKFPLGSELISNLPQSEAQVNNNERAPLINSDHHQFEGLLGDLMGIGKMLPPTSTILMANDTLLDQETASSNSQQQSQRLYMVRMLLGNEFLADAIASLCQQMSWDLVSVVYDDELDMIDLHDELVRQLFMRNIQLALDEQISMSSPPDSYDKLLQRLASKTQWGSRVVITLLGTGSARLLLDSFAHLRNQLASKSSSELDLKLAKQANSLLWVTISDREPYYSLATNALGTIAISNSVSLIPEFKSHFDGLVSDEAHLVKNRWWQEYLRAILVRHQKDLGLISSECAKWQVNEASPLREKCRSLNLGDLVRIEQLNLSINSSNSNYDTKATNGEKTSAAASKSGRPTKQPKLVKYLAGGWEHNGMDVINSVLAIANGLESVRQTLCPGSSRGICDEMRQFISPQSHESSISDDQQQPSLPMMSELIYNELLRSTFQLADGRLFNLVENGASQLTTTAGGADGGGHQLEGKLKLFNLRYLQPNSIGFVRFGTFDRQDGLIINSSKALHYSIQFDSSPPSTTAAATPKRTPLQALPVERVKSSCEDSSKCLMLSQFVEQQNNSFASSKSTTDGISEEELASGLNSLFKLDHPAIVSGQQQQTLDKQEGANSSATGSGSGQQSKHAAGKLAKNEEEEEARTHEMRWQPPISDHFHWPTGETTAAAQAQAQGSQQDERRLAASSLFEVVVLLPLHKKATETNRSCSRELNLDTSFQHLAALAYASQAAQLRRQQLGAPSTMMNGSSSASLSANDSKQMMERVELTTTVIDYCEDADLAEQKLSRQVSLRRQQRSSDGRTSRIVAVIDFDENVSRRVGNLVSSNNLLHLTIGSPTSASSAAVADRQRQQQQQSTNLQQQHHLHLTLMPSKMSEIEALLAIISSMPEWKLVHLIYTDHHHYRDEFVRRANEANICVSKLIWIPRASEQVGEYSSQLEKTRELFIRELHDYRSAQSSKSRQQAEETSTADGNSGQSVSNNEGLNSTRVLVVLASGSSHNTNRLILEAASESMLEDYVWLTSHEWLRHSPSSSSSSSSLLPLAGGRKLESDGEKLPAGGEERKPRYFVSTRFETSHESHEFSNYFTQLTPAIHRPIPTDWFDEFWQQKFTCRLPITTVPASGATLPMCAPGDRLQMVSTKLDDRVHFVIRAMLALQSALEANSTRAGASSTESSNSLELAENFRDKFETMDRHESRPYGFQLVHRLLPSTAVAANSTSRRRQNSRQMDDDDNPPGELARVGIWRNGELILATRLASASKFDNGQELPSWLEKAANHNDDEPSERNISSRMQKSLSQLESIESRCLSEKTCHLCEQQIEQTSKLIQLEEARLLQSQSAAEPKAISSIDEFAAASRKLKAHGSSRKKSSILDSSPNSPLEFDDAISPAQPSAWAAPKSKSKSDSSSKSIDSAASSSASGDDFEVAASSLFDANVKQLMQAEEQADLRRHFAEQQMAAQKARHSPSSRPHRHSTALLGVCLSLFGIICMLFTMTRLYPAGNGENWHLSKKMKVVGAKYGSETILHEMGDHNSICWQESIASREASRLANLINYFLLTGLLMLFSINVAFVLPATMSVCWFRRIGLATSYTVIFGSILAQIQTSGMVKPTTHSKKMKKSSKVSEAPSSRSEDDPNCGGSDVSEVEVSFESLPPIIEPTMLNEIQTASGNIRNHTLQATSASGYQLSSSTFPRPQQSSLDTRQRSEQLTNDSGQSGWPLTILMSIILIQMVISVVWLIEQPPEPTLYLSCWYCSSPFRSQTLFLYEALLSLMYPAVVLVFAWLSSLVYHLLADKNQVVAARQRLLDADDPNQSCGTGIARWNSNNIDPQQSSRNFYDKQIREGHHVNYYYKLRDSRSLVIATTLLIVTWSIVTLKMISPTNKKLFHSMGAPNSNNMQQASDCNTTILIYANIISGSIVFAVMFMYRLFQCNPLLWTVSSRAKKNQTDSSLSTFRSISGNRTTVGCRDWDSGRSIDGRLFFTRSISEFNPRTDCSESAATSVVAGEQHERLGLRQFNSYGTYNQGSQFDAPVVDQRSSAIAACDKNAPNRTKKKSKRMGKSSLFRAMVGSSAASGSSESNSKAYEKMKSANQLHRRPSTGSVASSTTKLVTHDIETTGGHQSMGENDDDIFAGDDTISCASSVASSSTSQVHGNDLYPIDCSLQLDSQQPDVTLSRSGFVRSSSFRRQSLRRSTNKLSSVREEQGASNEHDG